MANEALIAVVKRIAQQGKGGDVDGAYAGYRELFTSAEFAGYRPEDQRQALKLMTYGKITGKPTPAMVEAHRAAMVVLLGLTAAHNEPLDWEMLGICQQLTGDEASAGTSWRTGLDLERARDAGSVLCGTLMRRASSV